MSAVAPLQSTAVKPQQSSHLEHRGRLLQRKCDCGSPTSSLTGECEACRSKKGLQAKLTIGTSNDPLELEADRVADQVLAAPLNPAVSTAPPHIQRFTGQSNGQMNTAPASVDRVLANSGRPLNPALRHDMEQRFGHDFSRVRVHTGGTAEQSTREVNANAYTVGHDVVFGAGQFAPETDGGRRLIAHELTHVIQQSGSSEIHTGQTNEKHSLTPIVRSALNFAPIGVMRTIDPCLDKCEKEFSKCLEHSNFPPQCIGARSDCQRRCSPPPSQPFSPSPEDKHACVAKEQIPLITVPVVAFDDKVFMQTDVDIEWKTDNECDCACGEYRQYVKGHILKNNQRYDIGLCEGAKLEETTWHEDGDSETNTCYGHRNHREIKNDIFDRPNRESGCHYHGKDEPSVPGRPGDIIDVDLKFKGQTYDKCINTFGEIHEWTFTYKGPLGGGL